MATAAASIRAKQRPGDRVFSGTALAAGATILILLAAVAIFLIAQGIPGVLAGPGDTVILGDKTFWEYVAPLAFGTLWAAALALLGAPALPEPPPYSSLAGIDRYDEHLARVRRWGTTPNGVFGAKLMWGYLGDFADLLRGIHGMGGLPVPELLGRAFPNVHYVRITRRDKVRQAVSLWKAVQTQAWRAGGEAGERAQPAFSFRAINYLVRLLTAHDASGTPTSSASARSR